MGFLELGQLVNEQGEMVDNIFQHVSKAEINVEEGTKHLDKAQKLAIRNRKMKMMCGSILFVIILIVFLVLLNELGAFSSSPPYPPPPPPPPTTTIPPPP